MVDAPAPLAVPDSPMSDVAPVPVQGTDRIGVLDVLRGIALLGMILVHFIEWSSDPGVGIGHAYHSFLELVLVNRFHSMFAILFGVGFAVQLRRAEARGDRFAARYARRLLVLALFGIIAQGFFGFSILFGYAKWGFALLLVRNWSHRALVIALVLCAASPPLYWAGRASVDAVLGGMERVRVDPVLCAVPGVVLPSFRSSPTCKTVVERLIATRRALGSFKKSTSFRTVVAGRLRLMWQNISSLSPIAFLPAGDFVLFLIGLLGLRLGVFERPREHRRLIISVTVFFAIAGLVTGFFVYPVWRLISPTALLSLQVIVNIFASTVLSDVYDSIAYIGAILLLVAYRPVWLRRLSAFGIAGRMALTNYMLQIIVIDLAFSNYALALKISATYAPLAALALFAVEVALSRWWLARFRYGPLEWVWRSAAYWKLQPMRLPSPQAATS